MIRQTFQWILTSATLVFLYGGTAQAASDPYKDSAILPKCECLIVRGAQFMTEADFQWPATVRKTEGQWLWIEDDGRSRPSGQPCQGWVRKSEVILTEKDPIETLYPTAIEYFTAQLAKVQTCRAFWLRGVAWEIKQDFNAARDDYQCAINCPGILGTGYADEAFAGHARCLAALMIRDNSALFAKREGIDEFWIACGCCVQQRKCKDEAPPKQIWPPDVTNAAEENAAPEKAPAQQVAPEKAPMAEGEFFQLAANKAAKSMKQASLEFLVAISLKPRPRTFVDWADSMLVANPRDIPAFGFFDLPTCLGNAIPWGEETLVSRPELGERVVEAYGRILMATEDILRCECPINGGDCCANESHSGCACGISVPMLCNRALEHCRMLERAYITRGRYYQSRAEDAVRCCIERVNNWRRCRDQTKKEHKADPNGSKQSLGDLDSAKADLNRLQNYQHVLEESLQSIRKVNGTKPPNGGKAVEDTISLRLVALLREIDKIAGDIRTRTDQSTPIDPKSITCAKTGETLESVHDERVAVKCELSHIQQLQDVEGQFFDFRCRTGKAYATLVSQDNGKNVCNFYYYWNLAIRDASEAIAVAPSKSIYAPTAYLVKAELLLMRISPTTLQPVEDTFEDSDAMEETADSLQDLQLAQQAAAAAQQAAKLAEYQGAQSLTVWAAALAATGDYDTAIRRQKSALAQAGQDQKKAASKLLLAYCAAKKAHPAPSSSCDEPGFTNPFIPAGPPGAVRPTPIELRVILEQKPASK